MAVGATRSADRRSAAAYVFRRSSRRTLRLVAARPDALRRLERASYGVLDARARRFARSCADVGRSGAPQTLYAAGVRRAAGDGLDRHAGDRRARALGRR